MWKFIFLLLSFTSQLSDCMYMMRPSVYFSGCWIIKLLYNKEIKPNVLGIPYQQLKITPNMVLVYVCLLTKLGIALASSPPPPALLRLLESCNLSILVVFLRLQSLLRICWQRLRGSTPPLSIFCFFCFFALRLRCFDYFCIFARAVSLCEGEC